MGVRIGLLIKKIHELGGKVAVGLE
jgi:hypothetical protein